MNSRDRFLAACKLKPLERPPIWVMRQAGRYLPEYRELKSEFSFLEMVRTPELAAKVTLQPLERFDLDAAIIFSDILVIPEALGFPYSFREQGGIEMESSVNNQRDIDKMDPTAVEENLQYVTNALRIVRNDLGSDKALIGFGGSPWTLATYMIEGSSSKSFAKIKSLMFQDKPLFEKLLEKLTESLILYFRIQIDAGVDVIQIFDSWGGVLSHDTFWDASAKYMHKIVNAIQDKVPIIVFSKGSHHWLTELKNTGADVLGFDWTVSLAECWDRLGGQIAVQGNLDPAYMNTTPEIVALNTQRILGEFGKREGHIFNLGHGIMPQAKIECMEALVNTVKSYNKHS